MSTRSAVGFPEGDGWKGRYVHSDGYPSAKVPELRALVERDGLSAVLKTITEEHYGWSNLNINQPDISGITVPAGAKYTDFGYGTPEYVAWNFGTTGMNGDGRFANVPGYGVAYTTEQEQSSPDDWVSSSGDDWGTEYAYVLSESGLAVFVAGKSWKQVAFVRWDEEVPAELLQD